MVLPREASGLCRTLIGRAGYLEQFRRVLEAAAEGHGSAIAISGEAGIGKSRLTSELKFIAGDAPRPFDVASGVCFEFDTTTPYAPIVDMLRGCMTHRTPDSIRACAGQDGPELLRILPELAGPLEGVQPATPRDPDLDKRLLFNAISGVLMRLAAASPLLLVLEDVHWSDDASMEFLTQFSRRLASSPVVLVLNFRSDEVQPSLRRLLAALERERISTEWQLNRLSTQEIEFMLTSIFELEHPPVASVVRQLQSLTDGNPFFIEEILSSLIASGEVSPGGRGIERISISHVPVPRSVQAAVQERTEALSPRAKDIVRLAAISGRRFDFRLLEAVSGLTEDELLDVIKELIGAQLVAEESADHFAFRHALTQQAIYSEMLARERRSLHASIGDAIQTVYGDSLDSHLAELSHHFQQAERWDETYFYARRAGERALALNAPHSASEQLTRALAAAEQLAVRSPAAVFRSRGKALEAMGEFDLARADYERAFDVARTAGDGAAEWQALIDIGFLWVGRDYERAGSYFQHARDLADLLNDEELQAMSLNRLGNWLVNVGRADEGIELHKQSLLIAERRGDTAGRAATLDLLGMANGLHGNHDESLESYRESLSLYRQLGDRDGLATALAGVAAWYSPQLMEATKVSRWDEHEAVAIAQEAVSLADSLASVSGQMFAHMSAGQLYIDMGRYGEAIAHAETVCRLARETEHQQWLAAGELELGMVAYRTYDLEYAISRLELALKIARELGSAWWIGNSASYLARALLQSGHGKAASDILLPLLPSGVPSGLGQRRTCMAWAETQLAMRDVEGALTTVDGLISTAPGSAGGHMPMLRHLRGRILGAGGRLVESLQELEHARGEAAVSGTLPIRWAIDAALAEMLLALRRSDEAEGYLESARETIERIAMLNEDDALRERFRAGALASLPAARPRTANQAAKAKYGGLTAREREVAALIAKGRSNREIAEELVLGERTIETHVGNILGKLGFSSRSQVAAWAVQVGLA